MKTRLRGTVTSDANAKTLRVEVQRRYRHPKYGKIVRGRTVCHTHDPHERGKLGDVVEIVECKPHSKLKRWELVRVVQASDEVAVQASLETEADVPEATGAAADNAVAEDGQPIQSPEGLTEPPTGDAEPAAKPEGLA
ncbi:30S ribosomal protein S17 [Alienimonas sp. DA493]|uniref:30S ribosomal protein S17 n=1 Tax=Alienimonas sp. DA493 TaxID=3373605 RepID=UPI003754E87A